MLPKTKYLLSPRKLIFLAVISFVSLFIFASVLAFLNTLGKGKEVTAPKKLDQSALSKKQVLGTITVSLPVVADSFIDSSRPNQNFGGSGFLQVQKETQIQINYKRILLRFDLSNVPARSSISSAYIKLHQSNCYPDQASVDISINKISDAWEELGVTWNNQPPFDYSIRSPSMPCSQTIHFYNAGEIVQQWVNGAKNYGVFLMLADNESSTGDYLREYISKDNTLVPDGKPTLEVTYTPPAPTVSIWAKPTTITLGQSSTLSWSSTDADSVDIQPGIGLVGPSGSKQVSPTASTIYTATAYGPGGPSDPKSVLVTVNPPPAGQPPPGDKTNQPKNGTNQTGSSSKDEPVQVSMITSDILNTQENILIEQDIPVTISYIDPNIFLKGGKVKIKNISNIDKKGKKFIRFEGTAKAKTLVTLYILSNPVIVTVNSDTDGRWSYDREKNIEAGKHTAFATIYDEGVTRRSNVVSFYVAKSATGSASLVIKNPNLKRFLPYGLALGGCVAAAFVILVMYRIYARRKATSV